MARAGADRRFGPGPYLLGLRRIPARWAEGFPYDVPAVAAAEDLDLATPVTLLAGENGSGKSTLVEAIAEAVYELGDHGLAPCDYDSLDAVRLMRGFLDAPERYLAAALGDA